MLLHSCVYYNTNLLYFKPSNKVKPPSSAYIILFICRTSEVKPNPYVVRHAGERLKEDEYGALVDNR